MTNRVGLWGVWFLLSCARGDTDRAISSDTVTVDPLASVIPSVAMDETGEAAWSFGGLRANPDDELQFRGILQVVELSGGRRFINEGSRVRVLDSTGLELWRHGREGAGPQEFRSTGWPCRLGGDTVAFMDQRNARFALVELGVGTIATVPSGVRSLREGACTGDGGYVTTRTAHDTVTQSTALEVWRHGTTDTSATLLRTHPLPPRGSVGAGDPSAGFVDSLLYIADPTRATIDLFDRRGTYVRSLAWGGSRVPVTDENIPERFGAEPAEASEAEVQAWWGRIRSRPRTEYWPAFGQVVPDGRGNLWIREAFQSGQDSTSYWVVATNGDVRARVRIPRFTRERMNMLIGPTPSGLVFRHIDTEGGDWLRTVKYPEALNQH
jgi:hypothetical protein